MKEPCFRCKRPTYFNDKVGPLKDGTIFHRGCFKCWICGSRLTLKSYHNNRNDTHDLEVYCAGHVPTPGPHDPIPHRSNLLFSPKTKVGVKTHTAKKKYRGVDLLLTIMRTYTLLAKCRHFSMRLRMRGLHFDSSAVMESTTGAIVVNEDNVIIEDVKQTTSVPTIEPLINSPTLIFPLGSENSEHLQFPVHILHYSVSPDARYAYVIGQETGGHTHLNVWDFHKGTKCVYKYSRMQHIRHFYALNNKYGFAVSSKLNMEQFLIFYVYIDHVKQQLSVKKYICGYTSFGHVQFWSSCRYKESGIVFVMIDQRGVFIHTHDLNDDEQLKSGIFIDRGQFNDHYFVGQPFIHDEHVIFLEREYFNLRFTGRVVRIALDSGKMQIVSTNAAPGCSLFSNDQINASQLPNRIKHVERNGQLWAIMESSPTSGGPFYTDALPLSTNLARQKFIGVLDLSTWLWREVRLDIDANYDEMSLDITTSGTVVIIKRGNRMNTSIVYGYYFLQTGNPKSLLRSSFHKLIHNYETLRFLRRDELHAIGVIGELI